MASVAQRWGCRPSELLEIDGIQALIIDAKLHYRLSEIEAASSNSNNPSDAVEIAKQKRTSGVKIGTGNSPLYRKPDIVSNIKHRLAKQAKKKRKK